MSLAEKYPVRYTVEDWKKWEGDWELVEGVPYALASPKPKNQIFLVKIASFLTNVFKDCKNVNVAVELDWFISSDTVVKPDLLVFCGEIPDRLTDVPDLIVEILSPSTKIIDEGLKFELYQLNKVKYYIIFDLEENIFKIYEHDGKQFLEKKDDKFVICGCNFSLNFNQIFG
ncbi:Uma2 family endonuclease [Sulfurihydrogenibium sp.]|uniref:Uma2 family endonuclease n=1 Tax=Sulfurihydrogenibium sp. TaxID=2053621 RepID=UPI002611F476|nr:Uma2 family endonuclease [Sulfurihydrogenibium sp.]